MRRDLLALLDDIRDAAGFIVEDTAGLTFETFEHDRRSRQLVERNFEIIGFRNALIHGYDVIDYPTVWRAVQESLPVLRAEVDSLLGDMAAGSPGTTP